MVSWLVGSYHYELELIVPQLYAHLGYFHGYRAHLIQNGGTSVNALHAHDLCHGKTNCLGIDEQKLVFEMEGRLGLEGLRRDGDRII